MIALIQPPNFSQPELPKAPNAPTGLLPVMRPSEVSATIMV